MMPAGAMKGNLVYLKVPLTWMALEDMHMTGKAYGDELRFLLDN
jgi:hypothetical protein